jgi:8-oxo-dGTP diphosphatase
MPSKGVNVVVFNTDRTRVLLQKREDFRVWAVPGGNIEPGESPEEAGIRETYEETGYHIELDRYVGEYWRPQMPNGGVTMLAFTGHVTGGSPDERGWESVAVDWFAPNSLPGRTVSFSRDVIADALVGHAGPVKRTQTLPLWQISLLRVGFVLRNVRNRLLGRQ